MKAELRRRASLCDQLSAHFAAHPGEWISIAELATVAGVGAWRSRLVELRERGMVITWNRKNGAASAYQFTQHEKLGRDAATWTAQPQRLPLYDGPAGAFQR